MSEDSTEVQETTDDETVEDYRTKIDDIKTAKREIDKLRTENAKHRVNNKKMEELESDAKKWQEHLESQKSEFEKLSEAKAELEKKLAEKERAILQRDLVAEFGIDPELTEFVVGDTEDEMRAKAEKLAKKAAKAGPPDLLAGQRGAPVVGRPSSGAAFIDALAKK